MPGKATTALSLPMDRQEVESHIRWLAMGQTKVKKSMCSIKKNNKCSVAQLLMII